MPNPDVLLVCALKDEYDQVRQVTDGLVGTWVESHDGPRGWTVARATFETTSGPLSIVTSWATHLGREQTSAVVSLLNGHFGPKCLAMSGICAGRRDDVSLGDVIFADRLWSYDSGKTVVEGGQTRFEGDMLQYRAQDAWIQRMQALSATGPWLKERPLPTLEQQESWVLRELIEDRTPSKGDACPDWKATLERLWKRKFLVADDLALTAEGRAAAKKDKLLHPDGPPPVVDFKIHVAPIATGADVRQDAGIFPRLKQSMRKVLGVEMEAAALGAMGAIHDLPVLVAKAAADFGDEFKDDRYRTFAARASAECLIALLRRGADLLIGANARPQ